MDPKKRYIRLSILAAVFLILTSLMSLKLLDLQVVNGTEVRADGERTVIRTDTVDAARGEIYDRNGVKLVANKTAFRMQFDYFLWDKENQNRVILDAATLLAEYGLSYTDTLPISDPPYRYTYDETKESAERTRMENLIKLNDWEQGLSAAGVMEKLGEKYGVEGDVNTKEFRTVVGIRYDMARRNFSSINPFTLASDIPLELVTVLAEQGTALPGVTVEVGSVRTFETEYASHILGHTGLIFKEDYEDYKALGYPMDAIVGRDGMEKALESTLRGTDGSVTQEVNLSGRVLDVKEHTEAIPGSDCYLTIDIGLQEATETSLVYHIDRINAESVAKGEEPEVEGGAAVAIDVETGEVLAVASYPDYDVSQFNRAIAGAYAPGSVFKMVTATAALQSGVITPETTIEDKGVYDYYAPDYLYHCWYYKDYRMTHGALNVAEALKESCNYFFYEVGRIMGIGTLNQYTKAFGLGLKTGVELAGESMGVMAGPTLREEQGKSWYAGDTLIASIGQSDNLFTPIQLANYVATIANGGTRYETHLVKKLVTAAGETTYKEPVVMDTIDYTPEALAAVKEGMQKVTEDGTAGKVFADYPVAVLGKTGSAQVGSGKANGVFVLAAPADDPKIAIAVVVEHAGSGNNVAWIARDMLDAYLGFDTAAVAQ